MATRRSGPRSVSRQTTPAEPEEWANRLRARPDESPQPSPTRVTRGRAATSRVLGGSAGSVAGSVAASDAGSNDSYIRTRGSGNKSRSARAGTIGNTYGLGAAAQSSQMSVGGTQPSLAGAMSSELRVQTLIQRTDSQRLRDDPDEPNPERPVGPGVPNFPGHFLAPVREDTDELESSKSYGPLHEYGMGQIGNRNKSFSEAHEAGLARRINREPTPFHARISPSPRSSPALGFEPEVEPLTESGQEQEPELNSITWDRVYLWLKRHQSAILSLLLLIVVSALFYSFGPAMWKQLTSRATLPTDGNQATMTVTTEVHAHKTTTVTQIVKETSTIIKSPSIQERRNFFNIGIGATIDQRLTSTTRAPKSLINSLLGPLYGNYLAGPAVNQADTAIRPWTETGQSWCSASSDLGRGQLQLGVQLPFPVKPTAITLEHQPNHLSIDHGNSARGIELWVEIHEDSTGANRDIGCGDKPAEMEGEKWFCLAKMEFKQFDTEEKSQRIEFRNQHVFTDHVAVRVTNNWGSDHTCVYRVQLHGEMSRS